VAVSVRGHTQVGRSQVLQPSASPHCASSLPRSRHQLGLLDRKTGLIGHQGTMREWFGQWILEKSLEVRHLSLDLVERNGTINKGSRK
jgi:hypothetical protein